MAGMLQMRRSRGAFSGFLLVLLGLWGAFIPFIGPYFHFAYTPDTAWTYNTARLWLEILPGAAVFLGGFLLMIATGRHIALFGALLAAAAGAWFTLGTVPASTASDLPLRTRADAVPAKHARNETAGDTTQTIG